MSVNIEVGVGMGIVVIKACGTCHCTEDSESQLGTTMMCRTWLHVACNALVVQWVAHTF